MSEFKLAIKHRSSSSTNHHHNGSSTSITNSHHKDGKSYNVVTKAMSKYMPQTSYEQNCISKSLNHHHNHQTTSSSSSSSTITHDNRLLNGNTLRQKYLNISSNNSQYQLPDRKAKKPRIDDQLMTTKSVSITSHLDICILILNSI